MRLYGELDALLNEAVGENFQLDARGLKLHTSHSLDIQLERGGVGDILEVFGFDVGHCDAVKNFVGGIDSDAVGQKAGMCDFVALSCLELALEANGNALAQTEIVVKLKSVGAHGNNLRALRELCAELAAEFVGKDAHVALGVGDVLPFEHNGAQGAAKLVAHECDTLVAQRGADKVGQFAGDDDIFRYAPNLNGHFKFLLCRLVEHFK